MGGCRCTYKYCPNTTKNNPNLHFFHYPVRAPDVCKQWIINAQKPHFNDLSEDQLRNKVVCENHFEDRSFLNLLRKRLLRGAIPTLDSCVRIEKHSPINDENTSHNSVISAFSASPQITFNNNSKPKFKRSNDVTIVATNEDETVFVLEPEEVDFSENHETVETYNISVDGSVVATGVTKKVKEPALSHFILSIKDEGETQSNMIGGNRRMSDIKKEWNSRSPSPVFINVEKFKETSESEYFSEMPVHHKAENHRTFNQKNEILKTPVKRSQLSRKYIKKIRQHSKDIAHIKKYLKTNSVSMGRKTALRRLGKFIPNSLFTVLKSATGEPILPEEIGFFKDLYDKSPEAYEMLNEKYHWNLPKLK